MLGQYVNVRIQVSREIRVYNSLYKVRAIILCENNMVKRLPYNVLFS